MHILCNTMKHIYTAKTIYLTRFQNCQQVDYLDSTVQSDPPYTQNTQAAALLPKMF